MNFNNLYIELAEKIDTTIEGIQWIDLWNSQVYNLEGENPFPAPAIFMAFRSNEMDEMGSKIQKVTLQVDFFLFYGKTSPDTYDNSYNQSETLFSFLKHIDDLNSLFHGSSGVNYNNMERVNFGPIDTDSTGNIYSVTYTCDFIDRSAQKEWGTGNFKDLKIDPAADDNKFVTD